MFTKLAERIVATMNDASLVADGEKDLYVYGFYMLLSHLFYFTFIILLGLILHLLAECALFFSLFFLIRGYAGGVHASKENSCIIYTLLFLLVSVVLIRLCSSFGPPSIAFFVLAVGSTSVIVFAPLESLEKRLSCAERERLKRISNLILFLVILLSVLTFALKRYRVLYACVMSIGLEGILLFVGWLKSKKLSAR